MKGIQLVLMAARYFRRYFRRYLFLFIALSFGFGIITAITGIQAGMEANVYKSAQSHYAGDLALVGWTKNRIEFQINDINSVRQVVEASGVRYSRIVIRTQFGNDGIVYYNGASQKHKYVLGVDWDNEADNFRSMTYAQGGFSSSLNPWDKEKGIILSSPVADQLAAWVGDQVTLQVYTRTGQVNTGTFVVQAVIEDSSIFGTYKCYVDRLALNKLIGFNDNEASTFGFYLEEGARMQTEAKKLQKSLEESELEHGPLVADRDELSREYNQISNGSRLFVITLPVYLSEVSELLEAINLIGYFLYLLMLIIIIVSVAVTFRLILHEREKEIGTLRGVGFQGGDIIFLLMMETVILFFCSLVTGFFFARFIIVIIGFFKFSAIPSIEIFMKGGKMDALFTLRTTLINCLIVLAVLFPTVAVPVHGVSRKPLSQVLTGGKD